MPLTLGARASRRPGTGQIDGTSDSSRRRSDRNGSARVIALSMRASSSAPVTC
ncbi:hypothetical protein Q760_12220 [Cellulomonas cellasea DSM 20118]|uniref:Uncharacterized protein n=1 Tax=Cellulomonas cellasea DSM 20118 TaxID=1408250 RepID=A0A0A0B9X1_9CELL|nr:hypothetical protein Q760_12220 [Cellulomonas cellasea DSM 20118]